MRIAQIVLTLAVTAAVHGASLTVVASSIPPEADRLAILVDGSDLATVAYAFRDLIPGAQSASSYSFSNVNAAGPFRIRVLAYNTQSMLPLRSGRTLAVPGGSVATVILRDVYAPYVTTPFSTVLHGRVATLSFRVADPGGWLEGTRPSVYYGLRSSQIIEVPPLQNLPPDGVWNVSVPVQFPIAGPAAFYGISVGYPLPPSMSPGLILSSATPWITLTDAAPVTLSLSGVPAAAQTVHLLVDGTGVSGIAASSVDVSPGSQGIASASFGVPAGSYRLRVAVSDHSALLASGQTRITVPASGFITVPLALTPVSATLDPGVPTNAVSSRWTQLSFTVTDAGGVLEGIVPNLLTGSTATELSTGSVGNESFRRVGPASWRATTLLEHRSTTGTVYFQPVINRLTSEQIDFLTLLPPQSLRILATPTPCSASPIPATTLPAAGGSDSLTVPVPPGCPWSFVSDSPWLTVFPASGVGPVSVTWTALPNFASDYRVGHLMLGDTAFFVAESGSLDSNDTRFVKLAYYAFLGRYPTKQELDFQVGALAAGFPRASLMDTFASSQEFQLGGRFIAGLYYGILSRDAEYSGWHYQRNAMLTGLVTASTLIDNFFNSQEYKLRFGTPDDTAFVRLLYRNVLMREATQAEVDFQVNALVTRQVSRNVMTYAFLNSLEFSRLAGPRLTAFLIYATLLGRDGTSFEITDTAASVAGGLTQRTLIDNIVNGREFGHRADKNYWF